MAMVQPHFFNQSHFILYFIIQLCLMSSQLLVFAQQVKVYPQPNIYNSNNNRRSSSPPPPTTKKILNKRRVPIRNVTLDRNSYLALLYVAGASLCVICLMLFPNLYRKPYHCIKNLMKNSKIHTVIVGIKTMLEKVFDYLKHYVEIILNIINFKLISKMILRLYQHAKSLIFFYSDKSVLYQWLMKEDAMSSDNDWDLESGHRATSPLMGYADHDHTKNNASTKNKKSNGHNHKKGTTGKSQNGSRNKPEALLPLTNCQINLPYRIMTDPGKAPASPISPNTTPAPQNIFVNTMALANPSPSSPDSVTMEIDSDMDSDSTLTPTELNTTRDAALPEIESREAVVEIMEKSTPNNEKMSMKSVKSEKSAKSLKPKHSVSSSSPHQNIFITQELPPTVPREHSIDYKSVQEYNNPYLTISPTSLPLSSLKEDTLLSPVSYEIPHLPEDINSNSNNNNNNNKSSSENGPGMRMPSLKNAGQDISSCKVQPPKSWEEDKKIKGILVNKPIPQDIDNSGNGGSNGGSNGGAFEVVNKKRGKRTHKHSLSFSVPLTSTIEVPLRNKSHKRSSSSSTTNINSHKTIESIPVNNAIVIGSNTFNTVEDNVSYSNAVQYTRRQLRKRSISTPIMLDPELSSQEQESTPNTDGHATATKNGTSTTSAGSNGGHLRRYSTSVIDNKLSYAAVLNSNLPFNEKGGDTSDNKTAEETLKKNTKITNNATTRSGGSPTGNADHTKNPAHGKDNSNGTSDQNSHADQNMGQDDNNGSANGNSSGNNGNNNGGGNNGNNNNSGNTNPNAGKGKNKKQKKTKNASGTTDENENEEVPGTPKKKAAKAKKEAKGKNKVAVDTAQAKANGSEIKSPPASKKKAAKAAANAKKKEANKSSGAEESGLLVTGEITYGKAGLQDEPIPTDEEAYNALFSENATYWTPAERTERIKNSPFYDHNHHIAKYGKIKYKPMVEYDTDMNEINYELEMDEAAGNEKGKKEDKKEKKKKKKANANANANASGASTPEDKEVADTKKGKKKKAAAAAARDEEDNEDTADEKITKSKKKGKAVLSSANASGDNDSAIQESGRPDESKKAKKKKVKAVKVKGEANESASEIEIPPVPAKAKKLKKAKKVPKKAEVSESEEESDSNSLTLPMSIPTPVLAPTATAESSLVYSSNTSTNTTNTRSTSPLSQSTTIQYGSNGNEELLVNNSAAGRSSAASLIFNKVSQPSPLSSVSYVNYYDDTNVSGPSTTHIGGAATGIKPNPTSLAQSPILPIQSPTTPLFGPSSTTPKMDSPTMFSFTNGPSLTISTAPVQNNESQVQDETIIDLFNRTNKSFRRPRSISLNSHFQPSNEVRSNLSPLLMSTFKNSSTLKVEQPPFLAQEQQFNNIKLNGNLSSSLPFETEAGLFNNTNLSTSYIPPMHSKSSDLINGTKETIPAQTTKSGLNDFNDFGSGSMANPIIKKPTENVIQRYRRARTLSSPAVPPSVDKKNHFYSPFMTGLDIKYDFYIPKSNAISPLSSSFTASDSHTYEMNREEMTRRRSQSINERNRPNINDF